MSRFIVCLLFLALSLLLIPAPTSARTWHVAPDSSGDALTIHAGCDSSNAGDTVVVACGTYYENGVDPKSGVTLMSETGKSDCVTIDAEWRSEVLIARRYVQPTKIVGFTLTHGAPRGNWPGQGGGINCADCASLTVEDCALIDNVADYGGGISSTFSYLSVIDCRFSGNRAVCGGGGLRLSGGPAVIVTGCTFDGNYSYDGGAVLCGPGGGLTMSNCTLFGNMADNSGGGICLTELAQWVTITNTLIASNSRGEGIWWDGAGTVKTTCCDIWDNAGGDWVGPLASRPGTKGNFSLDPRFCDPTTGNLALCSSSPCLSGNHPADYNCGGFIGAFDEGCECNMGVQPTTWGCVKALFRR